MYFIISLVDVSALEGVNVSLLPPVVDEYVCDPPLPNGDLLNTGYLVISPGLIANDSREYVCMSDDSNTSISVEFEVFGKFNKISFVYSIHM